MKLINRQKAALIILDAYPYMSMANAVQLLKEHQEDADKVIAWAKAAKAEGCQLFSHIEGKVFAQKIAQPGYAFGVGSALIVPEDAHLIYKTLICVG